MRLRKTKNVKKPARNKYQESFHTLLPGEAEKITDKQLNDRRKEERKGKWIQ